MLRLATWNVFWLGTHETFRVERGPRDLEDVARVLRRVDADVLVLQEIVDVPLLERLLAPDAVPGAPPSPRRYRLRDAQGRFLTTGAMRSRKSRIQKLVLAYDEEAITIDGWFDPFGRSWPGPRRPVVARCVHRESGLDFTVVGVHLKSGSPVEAEASHEYRTRAAEAEALAAWLAGRAAAAVVESPALPGAAPPSRPRPPRPPTDAVVLIGDLNAVRAHPSLAPLRDGLPGWTWHEARLPDVEGERWTALAERTVIDHVLTSPAATAAVVGAPEVYAFDLDPALDREPGGAEHWLRRSTDLFIVPGEDEPAVLVPNLLRISDHRPLGIGLEPSAAHLRPGGADAT